ncbi:uncharacterized protein LOC119463575 [Dermacentor silvarum]|uniref:uncharacterized protein LOC119463575 n=1 Tax=Dermacentor silvarum TaxID=543639 RepID=UPI00189A8339|nr:uncharacterized protein LOC119463575 [Dermacentor silvarum]
MLGFRAHLSTQDALIQLHNALIKPDSGKNTKALSGLDLRNVFDNVKHSSIVSSLAALQPGECTYKYISAFLSDRTVELSVGCLTSQLIKLGDRGNPQGAVLSPFLFNLAIRSLPLKLDAIHTLYADDMMPWTATGSDGQIEETLQRAADVVIQHVGDARLEFTKQV